MAEPVKSVEERFAEREAELFGKPPILPIYVAAISYLVALIVPLIGFVLGAVFLLHTDDAVRQTGQRIFPLSTLGLVLLIIVGLVTGAVRFTLVG